MKTEFLYSVIILEHHLDTFGHVNNAVYFQLYEQARWEWITRNNYGLEVVRELGQGPVIVEASCKFIREIRLRDTITIHCECNQVAKVAQTVTQKMVNQKGEVCSEASFRFVLFDTRKRRVIPPTERWLRALGQ